MEPTSRGSKEGQIARHRHNIATGCFQEFSGIPPAPHPGLTSVWLSSSAPLTINDLRGCENKMQVDLNSKQFRG